jgi:hypothetical protein
VTTENTEPDAPGVVTRIVGIYDADGGLAGETRYVVGHLLGRLECALCDITHGRVRRKPVFDELRDSLGVPLVLLHRNERTPDLVAATGADLPRVVAQVDGGYVTLLARADLERCEGDVRRFEQALRDALAALGLELPAR